MLIQSRAAQSINSIYSERKKYCLRSPCSMGWKNKNIYRHITDTPTCAAVTLVLTSSGGAGTTTTLPLPFSVTRFRCYWFISLTLPPFLSLPLLCLSLLPSVSFGLSVCVSGIDIKLSVSFPNFLRFNLSIACICSPLPYAPGKRARRMRRNGRLGAAAIKSKYNRRWSVIGFGRIRMGVLGAELESEGAPGWFNR